MNYPGRPVGPYQGAPEMSGENASDDNPGQPLEDGEYFLEGTSGPAVEPQPLSGIREQRFPGASGNK